MQKTSTQENCEIKENVMTEKGPKQSTIDFLKQFARVYTCVALLPTGLETIIPN